MKLLDNHKLWRKLYIAELIIMLMYAAVTFAVKLFKDKTAPSLFTIETTLIIIGILIGTVKQERIENNVSILIRWLAIIVVPFTMAAMWLSIIGTSTDNIVNIKWLGTLIYIIGTIIYQVMFLPIVFTKVSEVKYPWSRMIAFAILETVIFSGTGTWKMVGHPYLASFTSSGLMAAISFFIVACCIAYAWGYRLNPNLKFKKSNNFSWIVLGVLIIFAIVDVIWNDFGGDTEDLLSLLTVYDFSGPFHFTFNALTNALEAGILEEIGRYLCIIVLLEWLPKNSYQIMGLIFISALLFGGVHFINLKIQSVGDTTAQAIMAVGGGLLYGILYLYSGKIWLSILAHFSYDYCLAIQVGVMRTGNWTGSTSEFIVLLIQVIVPTLLTIWMLTGKRKRVLQENADRIMEKRIA